MAVSTTDLQMRIDQWINFKSSTGAPSEATGTLHARPELGTEQVPPRNETEKVIAGIWQDLLGIEPIGVHDNFFELGGQSLLATQVVARVRATFQTDLPLRRFFEGPTIAQLATAMLPNHEKTPEPAAPAAAQAVAA